VGSALGVGRRVKHTSPFTLTKHHCKQKVLSLFLSAFIREIRGKIFSPTTPTPLVKFILDLSQTITAYARFLANRVVADRCLSVAGSLTFTTLLALVPLFTVTITLTSKLPFTRDIILQLKSFVLKNFVPEMASRMVGVYMDQFALNASRLTLIGLAIVLITAIALIFTIENTFNDIWRANRRRTWGKRLRWAMLLLIIGPVLIALSLSVTTYLVRATHTFERALPLLDDTLLRMIPIAATALTLYMAYRWIPNRFVPARHALIGALLAAVSFEIMKQVFVIYIAKVPTYSLVYGAFASFPIFLLWIFLCWLVVLLGAEVSATLSYVRHREAQQQSLVVDEAKVRVFAALAAADAPRTFDELRAAAPMPIDHAEDALYALLDAGEASIVMTKPLRYVIKASS
jgi:membrane protein